MLDGKENGMELLNNMIKAFGDYPKLTAVLVIAVILTVFVCVMAGRASSRMSKKRSAELERIKEEVRLREKFALVSRESLQEADCRELVKGLTANIQMQLEKSEDIKGAFNSLDKEKRFVYALDYVFFEDADTLSSFFRLNGKPLTTSANEAFREIIGGEEAKLFERAYTMFDEDDETTSVIKTEIEENDARFSELDTESVFGKIRDYIADHAEIFNE